MVMAIVQPAQVSWCGLDLYVGEWMSASVKPFTSISDQIAILSGRGLVLDPAVAQQWLEAVGYYRLSGYWYPYRQLGLGGQKPRRDDFIEGTTLDEVVRLYEFDRKLRTLIHDGVERVEVALRSHVGYVLAASGPLAYQDASNFRSEFNHASWMTTAKKRAARARRHSDPIKHYDGKYGGVLPIWVLTEVLDLSDVSKLYDGLLVRDQWAVAERLAVHVDVTQLSVNQQKKLKKIHPLARWFEQLSVVRNTSAHHGRVWNRSFAPASTNALRTIDGLACLPEGQSEGVFGALTVMGHLLERISPGTTWPLKVRALVRSTFTQLPGRTVAEMDFPEGWEQTRLWAG